MSVEESRVLLYGTHRGAGSKQLARLQSAEMRMVKSRANVLLSFQAHLAFDFAGHDVGNQSCVVFKALTALAVLAGSRDEDDLLHYV